MKAEATRYLGRQATRAISLESAPSAIGSVERSTAGEGFEGLTGAEAYAIYTEGLIDAQMALGSRLIWSGSVQAQVVGVSEPLFQTMALLEYASPQVFLGFAQQPGDAPEARSAGLLLRSKRFTKWSSPVIPTAQLTSTR